MNTFSKIIKRINSKKYLLKHPIYVLTCVIFYFLKDFRIKINFYSDKEIVEGLKQGKSIIRFGDGDIVNILLGMENIYHRDDKNLRKMYEEIVSSYTKKSEYIFSVPRFITMNHKELIALGEGKLNWGVRMKAMFFLHFNKNVSYMDAHNFYYDNYFATVFAPVFKDKKVICLTNKRVIEDQRKNKAIPWKDIFYIESPEINAMDAYERIVTSLGEELSKYNKQDVVIFAAMGPVGKCIIFKYAQKGYQGIDIGRGLEVMYKDESLEDMYPELKINKNKGSE